MKRGISQHFALPMLTCLALICVTSACNRVPGKKESSKSVVAASSSSSSAAEGVDEVPTGELVPLEPVCAQACDNWVQVRFVLPNGFETLDLPNQEKVVEMLERQQTLNRADCEETCVKTGDRERALCLIEAQSSASIQACRAL